MMVAEAVSPLLVSHPPIKVFYYHYHNSIRSELDDLSAAVAALEETDVSDASQSLGSLKRRVAFLDRVYSIHSSVEDEVGDACPALAHHGTNKYIRPINIERRQEDILQQPVLLLSCRWYILLWS